MRSTISKKTTQTIAHVQRRFTKPGKQVFKGFNNARHFERHVYTRVIITKHYLRQFSPFFKGRAFAFRLALRGNTIISRLFLFSKKRYKHTRNEFFGRRRQRRV